MQLLKYDVMRLYDHTKMNGGNVYKRRQRKIEFGG